MTCVDEHVNRWGGGNADKYGTMHQKEKARVQQSEQICRMELDGKTIYQFSLPIIKSQKV